MAGIATTVWEFRATNGTANGGGGFDTASGGTDYSNQNAAQLQLTDLATSGIGVTTLTSATGGFTSAMIGNYFQFRTGTNLTVGFYRVTAHTDTNTVTLDRAPDDGVGGVSGCSGDLGGALDIITDSFIDDTNSVIPGNTIYIKNDGTMTLTGSIDSINSGTNLLLITIEGYNTTRGDNPKGANRPTIAAGANSIEFSSYQLPKNLIITSTANPGLDVQLGSINCKVTQTSGSVRDAFKLTSNGTYLISSEGISTNGRAVGFGFTRQRIINCYFHDSVTGINLTVDYAIIIGCVIDSCTNAIVADGGDESNTIYGNTFYNCTTIINCTGTGNNFWLLLNNILDAGTTGLTTAETDLSWVIDHNVWDNVTDISGGLSKGPNAVTGDPNLTDPTNGDFTLGSGSNAIDAGIKLTTDEGVVGTYKSNCGVDQDDVSAGGGDTIINVKTSAGIFKGFLSGTN